MSKKENKNNQSSNEQSIKEQKKKSKFKIVFIAIGILVLLLSISMYFLLIGPNDKVKFALIQDVNGNVEVQLDNNNWIMAQDNQELNENNLIRTNEGNVILNFNNGILINLEANTEIQIKSIINDKIELKQTSGTTWSKFINVLGVETYEIETPNSVAVVRGTEFKLSLTGNTTTLLTTDGEVLFKDENNELLITKFKKAENLGDGPRTVEISNEDKIEIIRHKEKLIKKIKEIRLKEIYKNELVLNQVKKQYDLDDAKIEGLLNQIDKGEIDPTIYIEKVPFKIRNMDKILKYNDEIKELDSDIQLLKNELE